MMKFIVYIILIVCLLSSCTNRKAPAYGVTFPEEVVLDKSKAIYSKEVLAVPPRQLEVIDSLLFLWRPSGCAAMVFKEKNLEEVAIFGKINEGPELFQSPFYVRDPEAQDCFYVEDITLCSLRRFKMYKLGDSLRFKKIEEIPLQRDVDNNFVYSAGCWINKQYYAAHLWWPVREEMKHFILLDNQTKALTTFAELPVPETVTDFRRLKGYQTSKGNRFYFVCAESGYIVCYEIHSPDDIQKKWEYWFNKPLYTIREGRVRWEEENLQGCSDIKVTSRYVYCLYKGKKNSIEPTVDSLAETILVFDLDGNPVKKIHLKRNCVRFTVSDDDKYLYLVYVLPDIGIAKYQIN